MTNDGDIVNKILRARNNHEKEYTVTVTSPLQNVSLKEWEMEYPF
jgi:23S rRNA pseudouridine2604 synthase